MRVNTWGIGVLVVAAVLLTGCTASTDETSAPASDCPELKEGATVDMSAIAACGTETLEESPGYASTSSEAGIVVKSRRYNPAESAMSADLPTGSMIIIGEDTWVKPVSGEWQVGDTGSTDAVVKSLSHTAALAVTGDPSATEVGPTGEYTVTGTGERLGQKVYVLSRRVERPRTEYDQVYEITEDYVVLAATISGRVGGQPIDDSFEITEWDARQDIVAPL